jgi:MoaA/NifB/PqqE/SkfB family radical SAM enzyme
MDEQNNPAGFRVFGIETSSYCNRHCRLCPRAALPANRFVNKNRRAPIKAFLEEEYVYSLFDQLSDIGFAGRVQMFSLNEPLLDERMPSFLKYGSEKGLNIRITTNGDPIRKDPSILDKILPYIVELSIGIYDYTPGKPGWEDERNRSISEWKKRLADIHSDEVQVRFSLIEKFSQPPRDLDAGFAVRAACTRAEDGLYVYYNGDVTHCCHDNLGGLLVGNVKRQSLEDILNSPERQFVLDALAKGERWRFASCRDCLDSMPERFYTREVWRDRDGEILRLGLKYGLVRYPQPGTDIDWRAKDYLDNDSPAASEFISGTGKIAPLGNLEYPDVLSHGPSGQNTTESIDLNTPYRFTIPENKAESVSKVHNRLVDLAVKQFRPGLPRVLMIPDRRYVISRQGSKSVLKSVYKTLHKRANFLHFPLFCGSVRSAMKYSPLWLQARPDIFIYCLERHDAKRRAADKAENVDIETFRLHLRHMFTKFLALGARVLLVTSIPCSDTDVAMGDWILRAEDQNRYNKAAIEVARPYGIRIMDFSDDSTQTPAGATGLMLPRNTEQIAEAISRKIDELLNNEI